jgi:hypothetical protein
MGFLDVAKGGRGGVLEMNATAFAEERGSWYLGMRKGILELLQGIWRELEWQIQLRDLKLDLRERNLIIHVLLDQINLF